MSKIEDEHLDQININVPNRVENNYEGFMFFSEVCSLVSEVVKKRVLFDFSDTIWFEANLVAIFSSIIENLSKKKESIVLVQGVNNSIEQIFKKNGFYKHYNLGEQEDTYDSTIPFKIFQVNDGEGFTNYLNTEVIPKIKLPLSLKEIKIFKKCLQEVFENASTHAGSDCVFTCGQYYHKNKRVAFTIVDTGMYSIGENVRKKIPFVNDYDAINWATDFGNTTKKDKDGGIGLFFLKDYLKQSGFLQIVSGKGYWEQNLGQTFSRNARFNFNGTIVNLVSDLKDTLDYEQRQNRF